jgi:hypothetical protein
MASVGHAPARRALTFSLVLYTSLGGPPDGTSAHMAAARGCGRSSARGQTRGFQGPCGSSDARPPSRAGTGYPSAQDRRSMITSHSAPKKADGVSTIQRTCNIRPLHTRKNTTRVCVSSEQEYQHAYGPARARPTSPGLARRFFSPVSGLSHLMARIRKGGVDPLRARDGPDALPVRAAHPQLGVQNRPGHRAPVVVVVASLVPAQLRPHIKRVCASKSRAAGGAVAHAVARGGSANGRRQRGRIGRVAGGGAGGEGDVSTHPATREDGAVCLGRIAALRPRARARPRVRL